MMRTVMTIAFGLLLIPAQLRALDDPTRPFGGGAAVAGEDNAGLQLTSTIVSDGRRLAIINGKTVRQGDRVGGALVLKIDPASVVVRQDGERKRLGLLPSIVKKDKR